nr:MAG TPA: hypothetical protein [Caudoviricetes sp.]
MKMIFITTMTSTLLIYKKLDKDHLNQTLHEYAPTGYLLMPSLPVASCQAPSSEFYTHL